MYASLASPIVFWTLLKKRLASPLPGAAAQDKMSSRARLPLENYLQKHPDYRTSAVLMLLYPAGEMVHTLIIERPSYEGIHSGQLALPGGRMDEGDLSPVDTALRETFEEVGVRVTREQVIGELTPLYIPPSNFLVHPYVAWLDERPVFTPDPREVEAILEVPLSTFLNTEVKSRQRIVIGTNTFIDAPCYMLGDQPLWGATAMMFSELEEMLKGE